MNSTSNPGHPEAPNQDLIFRSFGSERSPKAIIRGTWDAERQLATTDDKNTRILQTRVCRM